MTIPLLISQRLAQLNHGFPISLSLNISAMIILSVPESLHSIIFRSCLSHPQVVQFSVILQKMGLVYKTDCFQLGIYGLAVFLLYYLMKSFKEEMENQADIEQFNPQDILNAFRQLTKSTSCYPQELQASKHTPINPFKEAKEEQSVFSAISAKSERSQLPKKTSIIKKSAQRDRRLKRDQYVNENSLGRISNLSKSVGLNDQSELTERNIEPEDIFVRKESESITQQQIANLQIRREINQLEEQYRLKQERFEAQRQKEIAALKNILQLSYSKRIQYRNHLSFFGKSKKILAEKEILPEKIMRFLQTQDSNFRLRKSRRGNATCQDEEKLPELISKQKKAFVAGLLGKLSKEKERYGTSELGQYSAKLIQLSQSRITELKRCTELKDTQILCGIERASSNIEQVIGMDLKRVQQIVISCYPFNLTIPKDLRQKLFNKIREIHIQTKKLTSSSNNTYFPNKNALFVTSSGIMYNDDEVLVANEKEQSFMTLKKFLERVQFLPGEHGTWLLRVLLRACLKIVEEISRQSIKVQTAILPSNIFVNERFQFRFRNIFFNEILYRQFRHLVSEEELFFFPPQEKPEASAAVLWSIGVLAYSLYFGCVPFQKYQAFSWSSREHFLVINQLQIPVKSPANQKVKQFISACLSKRVNASTLLELSSDGFMATIK